jgi:hypothetical protein
VEPLRLVGPEAPRAAVGAEAFHTGLGELADHRLVAEEVTGQHRAVHAEAGVGRQQRPRDVLVEVAQQPFDDPRRRDGRGPARGP